MRLITLEQLRTKIGGRSRNAIFADIDNRLLPPPLKFSSAPGGKNYWDEEQIETALKARNELAIGRDGGCDAE